MLKLIICLACAAAIALTTLQMRQQQLELKHQAATLQGQIQAQQSKLWTQQVQIAIDTAPTALSRNVGSELELVPQAGLPADAGNWLNPPPRKTEP